MTKKQEEARGFLKKLENDPKHTTRTPEAEAQTKDDDMNDPRFHTYDRDVDPKWHKDAQGNWSNPDFED